MGQQAEHTAEQGSTSEGTAWLGGAYRAGQAWRLSAAANDSKKVKLV